MDATTPVHPPARIAVAGVGVTYGLGGPDAVTALAGIDLDIADGAFVSLVGPSGCGKSTLLRVIADLLAPSTGRVTIGDAAPADLRRAGRIGVMFQQPALMPWLTVADNVALLDDLVRTKGGGATGRARTTPDVPALLDLVGLTGFGGKRPHQLSGGMQQRAALARALALDPTVLLMDEPFAALDEITRERMAFELMRVWQQYRKTVVFVTHSLGEAVFLSDRVVLMSARPGRIHRVYDIDLPRPRTRETRLSDAYLHLVGEVGRGLYEVME
ncbi:MAG: ABC transporter ATP-binding protein [Rhodoplanes sp.]|uniref:ABC transporter ATP-binding protein n=1 Tax=Rhodoplanes sp. TaxID=1968906 RepID=UPI001840D909|nr:ABC transporter ATP-binding protein [Rhodoplanes sp.]NVO13428.1 ABC transporter ATP-binding protein [Rhodoplanes sp.]